MKKLLFAAALFLVGCNTQPIDRAALLERNNPHLSEVDTLNSLTVGNGGFAVTVDVTGLQSFPEFYSKGLPLGTQSSWGWHSFDNPENYRHEETLPTTTSVMARLSLMPPSPARVVARMPPIGIVSIPTVCTWAWLALRG